MNSVVSSRITEAREARALSMGELADAIGLTRQSISKYERAIISPSLEVLQAMSQKLLFPVDFFYKQDKALSSASSTLFFRSNSNIPKKVKTACRYQVKWADEVKKQLEVYVDFLSQEIPVINRDHSDLSLEDIEELALRVRERWGVSDSPVNDLIGLLENNGVIISQFATNDLCSFKGIDAFSSWENGTPYILFNSAQKSAVRTRFSILHELGHLLMHSGITCDESIRREIIDFADTQADRFAAAFLLPATSFPDDVRGTSLIYFEAIKKKWGAALSTIIKRCETLDLLSENQTNYLKRQMTTKKYWRKEPLDDEITLEEPGILKGAILMLIDNRICSRDSFLSSSAMPTDDLTQICSLPRGFFDGYDNRQKPILKVLE